MRILITGGAGFIGSHLAEALLARGEHVRIFDNESTGNRQNLNKIVNHPNLEILSGSILDLNQMKTAVKDMDYIFHCAASVGVFNIVNKPLSSLLTNVRGTENVFELAAAQKIPVLLTSSSEVYGKNTSNSLNEKSDRLLGSPLTLRWSYSEAKAIDESLAFAYHIERGLETRIVRFFNTVGPRQLGAYGMVLPRFVEAALKNEPIIIYGDGKQTRCFAHVYDVIDALLAVAFAENTVGKVVNIGNSSEISINELARKVISETASNSRITYMPYSEAYGEGFEDMERRVPDLSLIYNLVGWKPTRDLKVIIGDIIAEMKK